MPPPAAGQSSETSATMWILAAIFVALGFIWFFGHSYIVAAFVWIKQIEIQFLDFFAGWLIDLTGIKQFLTTTRISNMTFSNVVYVANQVGAYLRYPVVIFLLVLASVLFSKNIQTRYANTYSIMSLLKAESITWPYAKIALQIDLLKEDIDKGPWAMAMTPMQFAKQYQLVKEIEITPQEAQMTLKKDIKVFLLRAKAARVFGLQLGKLWKGVEALDKHTRALYAVFAAKAARDSVLATDLLKQFAATAAEGRVDYSGVEEALAKYKNFPAVRELTEKHAYVLTVMASMLQLARTDGVLSSAEFLWIKPVDRPLWFMLNTVGRQTAATEIGGPYAHWLAEKEIGRKLKTPMVDQAVEALEAALHDIKYTADKR